MAATVVPAFHDLAAVARMRYLPLANTGLFVSAIGMGGSALASVFGPTLDEESVDVTVAAIRAGVNVIDTAPWYGHGKSELLIGRALKRIPREAVYVHTKVGRYTEDIRGRFDFSAARTLASVNESLSRMEIDHIDVIQVHDPEFAHDWKVIVHETLPALQECVVAGKVKRIGMTSYDLSLQQMIIEASHNAGIRIDTSLTYCHGTLNDNSLLTSGYLQWAAQHNIAVMNASPLAMGMLTNAGPPAWHPAKPAQKAAVAAAAKLAAAKGFDISLLAMKYAFNIPGVCTTFISTAKHLELAASLAIANAAPTEAENAMILELMNGVLSEAGQGGSVGWHGLEVAKYWTKLGKTAAEQRAFQGGVAVIDGIYKYIPDAARSK